MILLEASEMQLIDSQLVANSGCKVLSVHEEKQSILKINCCFAYFINLQNILRHAAGAQKDKIHVLLTQIIDDPNH